MTSSLTFWIVAAVLGFWSIGAYNRLMRLRADANTAFTALAAEMAREVELVNACIPRDEEHAPSQFDGRSAFWAGLEGAAAQFAASLAAARVKPLEPDRMAALGAAQEILEMAWERAERDDAHDLAGPRLPQDVWAEHAQIARQTQVLVTAFNQAVMRYNESIGEFPALLLAWTFGFKPGRGLRMQAHPAHIRS